MGAAGGSSATRISQWDRWLHRAGIWQQLQLLPMPLTHTCTTLCYTKSLHQNHPYTTQNYPTTQHYTNKILNYTMKYYTFENNTTDFTCTIQCYAIHIRNYTKHILLNQTTSGWPLYVTSNNKLRRYSRKMFSVDSCQLTWGPCHFSNAPLFWPFGHMQTRPAAEQLLWWRSSFSGGSPHTATMPFYSMSRFNLDLREPSQSYFPPIPSPPWPR